MRRQGSSDAPNGRRVTPDQLESLSLQPFEGAIVLVITHPRAVPDVTGQHQLPRLVVIRCRPGCLVKRERLATEHVFRSTPSEQRDNRIALLALTVPFSDLPSANSRSHPVWVSLRSQSFTIVASHV